LNIKKVIADPHPSNKAAIRTFEKSGFANRGKISTADGDVILMEYKF